MYGPELFSTRCGEKCKQVKVGYLSCAKFSFIYCAEGYPQMLAGRRRLFLKLELCRMKKGTARERRTPKVFLTFFVAFG